MFWNLLIFVCLTTGGVVGGFHDRPPNLPCKLNDIKCITAASQWVVSTAIQGIAEKGIQTLDPQYHDNIEGHLGYLKYKVTKTNVEGTKTCKVNKASVNLHATSMHIELLCRRIHMEGQYDINGQLLSLPVEGNGAFFVNTTNYLCLFDTGMTYYKRGSNLHARYEDFKFKCELSGELDIDLRTLDGNKKKLSDTALYIMQLAKENAKLFLSLLDLPIHSMLINGFKKNLNQCLGVISITDLLDVNEKSVKLTKQ